MTKEQIEICEALGRTTMLPGSFNKRLAQSLSNWAEHFPDKDITEKQNEWMYRLLYKYRKQMPNIYDKYKSNPYCCKLTTPAPAG